MAMIMIMADLIYFILCSFFSFEDVVEMQCFLILTGSCVSIWHKQLTQHCNDCAKPLMISVMTL